MRKLFWVRVGDQADYESFYSIPEAAYHVAELFSMVADSAPRGISWRKEGSGFSVHPKFIGQNYISAYWGDKDAQPTAWLTRKEQGKFNAAFKRYYAQYFS
jgi:hypothetical protein